VAEKEGPDAGLLVFLVGAAFLALVGLVAEAGVVEAQVVAAAASGHPRGGRAAAAGFVAAGCPAERAGRAAGTPEGRLRARGSRGSGGGLLRGLSCPELVAALDKFLRRLESTRVDQVTDVARQFADEEGGFCILHRRWLQGGEVVPQDGGPGVAAHWIIQPLAGHLFGAEAVGPQEELLQHFVRVADGGGVSGHRADGGQFSQGPVEFLDRLGDVGCDKNGVKTVEPCLGRIGVEVG
jgi:hypothetical protein